MQLPFFRGVVYSSVKIDWGSACSCYFSEGPFKFWFRGMVLAPFMLF